MKILRHNKKKDTSRRVQLQGNFKTVLLLSHEDIEVDSKANIMETCSYNFTALLLPKEFEIEKKEMLEETKLWKHIRAQVTGTDTRIVYY